MTYFLLNEKNIEDRILMREHLTFKLCIFGDGGVGKTTLTEKYLTGLFKDHKMTIGVDFCDKSIDIDDKIVHLQIWDFAGEERFRFMLPSYVRGASGAIFMYDVTRYSSLNHVNEWLEVVKSADTTKPDIPIIAVGGKTDLVEKRSIHKDEAIRLLQNLGLYGLIECSSKTGENVESVFEIITRAMMRDAGFID